MASWRRSSESDGLVARPRTGATSTGGCRPSSELLHLQGGGFWRRVTQKPFSWASLSRGTRWVKLEWVLGRFCAWLDNFYVWNTAYGDKAVLQAFVHNILLKQTDNDALAVIFQAANRSGTGTAVHLLSKLPPAAQYVYANITDTLHHLRGDVSWLCNRHLEVVLRKSS